MFLSNSNDCSCAILTDSPFLEQRSVLMVLVPVSKVTKKYISEKFQRTLTYLESKTKDFPA